MVAGEVKALASQSEKSTFEVTSKITEIQNTTRRVAEALSDAGATVETRGDTTVNMLELITNLAKALELDPELPKLIKHVTVMGGTALAPGNVSAVAEANIWNDPEAAEIVFNAGWPVTMVGVWMGPRPNHFFTKQYNIKLSEDPPHTLRSEINDYDMSMEPYRTYTGPCVLPTHATVRYVFE